LEGKDQMTEGYRSRRRAGHLALRAVGVALLSGVVLTACSSSGKTSGGSTGSTSSGGTSSASGSTLLVGVVSSDTGPAGNTNQVPTTVKIWQDWINSHGGGGGHQREVME
jgi:ABC-type branched-subunit amino acid transport system substrate-binding protein